MKDLKQCMYHEFRTERMQEKRMQINSTQIRQHDVSYTLGKIVIGRKIKSALKKA